MALRFWDSTKGPVSVLVAVLAALLILCVITSGLRSCTLMAPMAKSLIAVTCFFHVKRGLQESESCSLCFPDDLTLVNAYFTARPTGEYIHGLHMR